MKPDVIIGELHCHPLLCLLEVHHELAVALAVDKAAPELHLKRQHPVHVQQAGEG